MQGKLIQTEKCAIVYGTFQGKENQELFRCPRELEEIDLRSYVNRERIFLGIENDYVEELRNIKGKEFLGYYRMYFSNGSWYGRWLDVKEGVEEIDVAGIEDITNWIRKEFSQGCDYYMEDYCEEHFQKWNGKGDTRYLIKPIMSDIFKIMIDTKYGNGDYPVRIYCYR